MGAIRALHVFEFNDGDACACGGPEGGRVVNLRTLRSAELRAGRCYGDETDGGESQDGGAE